MELDDSCPDCLDLAEALRNFNEKVKKIKAIAQNAKCEDVCPDQCYSAKQILEIIEGE